MAEFAAHYTLTSTHYSIKGLAELALEDWREAAATFAQAVQLFPEQAQLWFNLGVAQENLGQGQNAAASYEASIARQPSGEAYGNLSNVYRRLRRYGDAEASARSAANFTHIKPQAMNSLGLALGRQGKFSEAAQAFDAALTGGREDARVIANQANLAVDRLGFTAWLLFAKARALQDLPVIRRDEGMARLLFGDYRQGWELFEARLEIPGALRLQPPCPLYRGENLTGKKLLLLAEQGFGDTIMFCRYGRFFVERGAEVIWAVPQPLQRLLAADLPGQVLSETAPLPAADFCLPLMSAPYALGLPEPFGAGTYLGAQNFKAQTDAFPAPLQGGSGEALPPSTKSRIALVWQGSPTHERDHERSIALDTFAPLFEKVAADFYALTPAAFESDWPLIRLDHLITDFAATAALLAQMDCLISVDTSVAHLAGALGVKTYLLLPYCPDWRWGTQGETTPWYPGMTLLRQPAYGDWATVIDSLADKLV